MMKKVPPKSDENRTDADKIRWSSKCYFAFPEGLDSEIDSIKLPSQDVKKIKKMLDMVKWQWHLK